MDLLTEIAKNGLLGLLLALSLGMNFLLGKMLLYEKDKRIHAAEKVRDEIAEPLSFIKESLALLQEKVQISKDRR